MVGETESTIQPQTRSPELHKELVDLLYRQSTTVLLVIGVVSVFSALMMWAHAPREWVLAWLGYMLLSSVARFFLIYRYQRANITDDKLSRWKYAFFFMVTLTALGWGSLPLMIGEHWPISTQFALVTVSISVAIGASTALSAFISLYSLFSALVLLPLAFWLWTNNNTEFQIMGVLVVLFLLFTVSVARFLNDNVLRNLELVLLNQGIVKALNAAEKEVVERVRRIDVVESELDREKKLFDAGRLVLCRWRDDEGWPFEYVSQNIKQFGWDAQTIMQEQKPLTDFLFKEDIPSIDQSEFVRNPNTGVESVLQEYRLKTADGGFRWVMDVTILNQDSPDGLRYYDGYLVDITEHKEAELAVASERARADAALYSIGDGVIITDVDGRVDYVNPTAEYMLGHDLAQIRGMPSHEVLLFADEDSRPLEMDPVNSCLTHQQVQTSSGNFRLQTQQDAQLLPFFVTYIASPLRHDQGELLGCVLTLHDVTETRYLSRELIYQASHDALTSLTNRREFERKLERLLTNQQADFMHHVVLYMDLDQFKVVNDTCGHAAGDELLRQISYLLGKQLGSNDLLARLGGDEFALLLRDRSLIAGEAMAERLRDVVEHFRFSWEGRFFDVGVSIGLVVVDADSESVEVVMKQADMACYLAKEQGRNRVLAYAESGEELEQRQGDLYWVNRATEALKSEQMVLYAQKFIPLRDEENIICQEVLLRLMDGDEIIAPSEFIPALERYRKTIHVDRWVVNSSLEWLAQSRAAVCMSINVSAVSLSNEQLFQYIRERMMYYGVVPEQLCFEITETGTMSNLSLARYFIQELREVGCRFALDDFGTGLSSFEYLRDLPVDYLKIDGHFIRGIANDSVNYHMVSMMQQLSVSLGVKTIAECVENQEDFEALQAIGVNYAQGFFLAPPQPLKAN